mmetsp:Transcript_13300/g.24648  ORF Transcript_13300/g.24648 Transcript_13300/m.24648 type:complete len:518 (-) Transcript_13300:49-1602(-)|eukprot:CAMPEP_0184510394 /NCGR_PEP_ID=MMETSP0198_2-20121128/1789_1 /TAXON_ID=1112570 /ORGANISM="Thraustochytrium sp., Strain LLF1b" /LENGTH=517 /DNA_ID=CAMNT_0026900279 /DNA_START=131 /DNA_END=1684 /DNA_ORIENTATION=+
MAEEQVAPGAPQSDEEEEPAFWKTLTNQDARGNELKRRVRKMSTVSSLYASMLDADQMEGTWVYGMLWFRDKPSLAEVREVVEKRVLTIPRFRSRLKPGKPYAFEELTPGEIDVDYHLVHEVEPTTREVIQRDYIGDVYKNFAFDKTKPLWRYVYFENVEGRSMLLTTISHCIGDGVAQVEVLFRLLDNPETLVPKKSHSNTSVREGEEGGADGDASARPPPKRNKKPSGSFGPLNRSRIVLLGVADALSSLLGKPDKPSKLMRDDPQKASATKTTAFTDTIDLEQVKEIKTKYPGSTVNDILIALLSLTLRAYLEELGGAEKLIQGKQRFRGGFPINTRSSSADIFRDGSPHNKIVLGQLTFRLAYKKKLDLIWDVKRSLDITKLSPSPFLQSHGANVVAKVLPKRRLLKQFRNTSTLTSAMLSNVAGPTKPVSLAGHVIDDMQFLLYGTTNMYLGLLSFANRVSCGITMDTQLPGTAQALSKHWKPQFDALYQEVMAVEGTVPKPKSFFRVIDKL